MDHIPPNSPTSFKLDVIIVCINDTAGSSPDKRYTAGSAVVHCVGFGHGTGFYPTGFHRVKMTCPQMMINKFIHSAKSKVQTNLLVFCSFS